MAAGGRRSICAGDDVAPAPKIPRGGTDAYQAFALKAAVERRTPALPSRAVPALVLRGHCDFVRHEVADEYASRLGAKLEDIPGAGHAMWPAQSVVAREKIGAFLRAASPSSGGRSR